MNRLSRLDVLLLSIVTLGAWFSAYYATRGSEWVVMTDELLYERLAISIAKLGSPLPHIHGELIANVNQLYPLLLAPLFHDRLVPPALHDAHVLNAFVMSSVCLPTFLLARDVTRIGPRVTQLFVRLGVSECHRQQLGILR
jgi:hypothetical protein